MAGVVEIRRATEADWEAVRDVRLASLADTPDAFYATLAEEQAFTEEQWRDRLTSGSVTLLAELDGEVIGTTVVGDAFDDAAAAGLYAVWVEPQARGSGAGDALVREAVAVARDRGVARILLDVGDHNVQAQRLYARHGFRPTGRTYRFEPPREHITEHELELRLQS